MKKRGVRIALGLTLGLCLLWVGCGDDNGAGSNGVVDNTDFSAEADFYFRLDLGSHDALRLEGISGEVNIMYAYPLLSSDNHGSCLAIHVDNLPQAVTILTRRGFNVLDQAEL